MSLCRLDADDPASAWREHIARLYDRATGLEARSFDALHFRGSGTDFRLGLMKQARWLSGGITTNWGRKTIVNMPTEEVFTTLTTASPKVSSRRRGRCRCSAASSSTA
jgi:aminopeptidase